MLYPWVTKDCMPVELTTDKTQRRIVDLKLSKRYWFGRHKLTVGIFIDRCDLAPESVLEHFVFLIFSRNILGTIYLNKS